MIECIKCHRNSPKSDYEVSDITGSHVCPNCGYEGGKLSHGDQGEHQDEWDALFNID